MKQSILILAAGLGTRFKLKKKIPKSLIKLNYKEILSWQLENLFKSNIQIKDFHVVVGFEHNQLISFLKQKLKKHNIFFYINKNYKKTGCIYSFFKGAKNINNDLIYFNSDLVVSSGALNLLNRNSKKNNLILCRKKIKKQSTILQDVVIKNSRIVSMDLVLNVKTNYEAVGPVKINKKTLKKLFIFKSNFSHEEIKKMRCYSFFGQILKEVNLYSKIINDSDWHEFNNKEDLKNAKNKKIFER